MTKLLDLKIINLVYRNLKKILNKQLKKIKH